MTETRAPAYLYYSYDGMRCRVWNDASGTPYAECWDEDASVYAPASPAAIAREGALMSPEELAMSLRHFPANRGDA